jgi:hypothetical protein
LPEASVVLKDVPPFVTAARDPLSYARDKTPSGLKRRNFSSDEMRVIEDVYRTLFVQGYAVSGALNTVEDELPESEYRTRIVDFVKGATRADVKVFRSKSITVDIIADNLGKRYLRDWIFKGLSYRFEQGKTCAVLRSKWLRKVHPAQGFIRAPYSHQGNFVVHRCR